MVFISLGIIAAAALIFGPIIISIIAISKISSLEEKINKLEQGYAMLLQKNAEEQAENKVIAAKDDSKYETPLKKAAEITKTDTDTAKEDDLPCRQEPEITTAAAAQECHTEEITQHKENAPEISNFFSWAGGLLLVIGAIYTFVYLYQKGHISHALIISMAELAGIALAAAGLSMKKTDTQTTASALCASGLCVCYLAAYSAYSFYGIIGTVPAFAAMAITAAASFVISAIKDRQFIAFLALLAACLTPHLLSSGNDKYIFYFTYLLIVNIPAALLAIKKKWNKLLMSSLAFTFMAQFAYAENMGSSAKTEGYFWAVCLAYSIAAAISAAFLMLLNKKDYPETEKHEIPFAAALPLSVFAAAQTICLALCLKAGTEFKCFAAAVAVTAFSLILESLTKKGILPALSLISWGIFYTYLCSVFPSLHYNAAAPITVFAMFYSFPLICRKRFEDGGMQWLSAAVSGFMVLLPLYNDFAKPFFPGMSGIIPLALSLLYIVPAFLYFKKDKDKAKNYEIYSGAAVILLAIGISMQLSGKWLTAMMALYAAMLCRLHTIIRNRSFIPLAQVLFIIAAARLIYFLDSPSYFNQSIKIFNSCLMAYGTTAGAMIISAKYFLPDNSVFRKALYAAAAVLLFLLMNIEIADYFSKGSLEFNFCGKFAEAIAYTLSWAIYGTAACVISIYSKSKALRNAGIAAIAAALAKLGLIDLWKLETLYRIFGAFGMAALLIGTAWIFQRQNRQ